MRNHRFHYDALEFAAGDHRRENLDDLIEAFAGLITRLGFHTFIFTGLPSVGPATSETVAPLVVANRWPVEWATRYQEEGYIGHDPVSIWSSCMPRPFRWQEAQRADASTPLARRIAGEAWDFGLADGIAVPLTGYRGRAIVSLACAHTVDIDPIDEVLLCLAGSYFQMSAEKMLRRPVDHGSALTLREIDIARWLVMGKSQWEISTILNISERTVKAHIASIRGKCNATTTTQAIALLILHGKLHV